MEHYEEITDLDTIVEAGHYYTYNDSKFCVVKKSNGWTVKKYRISYYGIKIFIKQDKPKFPNPAPYPHGY